MNLTNVSDGHADVVFNGRQIGFVSHRPGMSGGWYAYDADGKCVSPFPSPKRSQAAAELVSLNVR